MAEPSQTDANSGESPLARFVSARFTAYRNNRSTLEKSWTTAYASWRRDLSMDPKGPWKKSEFDQEWMSTSVDDITRRKLLGAYGMIRDAVTKGGNLAFMFEQDKSTELMQRARAAQYQQAVAEVAAPNSEAVSSELHDAEDIVHDQLKRCKGMVEYLRAIFSQLLYGRGWLKRYVHNVPIMQIGGGGVFDELAQMPGISARSIWRIYWDMENEDIRKGDGLIESDRWSPFMIRALKKSKAFDSAAVDRVLKNMTKDGRNSGEGMSSPSSGSGFQVGSEPPGERQIVERRRTAEVFESWGRHPRALVEKAEANVGKVDAYAEGTTPTPTPPKPDDGDDVECVVTVVAGSVVRVQRTRPEDRPYYTCICEPDTDTTGQSEGIADALHQTQHTRTGIRRAIENNLKLTSNFTAAGKKAFIRNWKDRMHPGQFFEIDMDAKSVDEAFKQIVFQDITQPLISAMEFFGGEGDLSSMIPRSEQGLPDGNAPNTAFELKERLEKAGMYLAIAIFNADGMLEEFVRDMLIDNITLGNINPSFPLSVKALGFTSFQNRTIRAQGIVEFLSLRRQDPEIAARTKIGWAIEEYLKDKDIAPEQVMKTDEEYAQYVSEQQAAADQQAALQQASGGKFPTGDSAGQMVELQAKVSQMEANTNLANVKAAAEERKSLVNTAEAADRIRQSNIAPPPAQTI